MNELFDKLILRVIFTLFICLILFLYKYAHSFLYPSSRSQIFKRFYPSKNSADTIHLFSRIIGIGIVFSEFHFYMSEGILLAIIDFFIQATLGFVIYLASIYIIESIVLYNFEYVDEISKRKNFSYSLISFALSISTAYIIKTILFVSHDSLIVLLFLWLFALVITGFATKSYQLISKLSFNKLLIQKNLALAFSYMGFIWGWTLILSTSLNQDVVNIKNYAIQCILKILLAIIIFPIFKKGLIYVFKIQDDISEYSEKDQTLDTTGPETGYGIFEGCILFTSSFLTSVITENIYFDTFYPIFS